MAQAPARYPLARTHISSARLNLQHYQSKQTQGFLLHPSIKFETSSPVVADIGTGTGIWLLDLAENFSDAAQFWGFDINISQTPHRDWLPDNVFMEKLDIFGDIPDDLVAEFDLVHVRAFIWVVQSGTPQPIISKLMRLLKPGGYIQWTELDYDSLHVDSVVPIESLSGTQRVFEIAKSPNPKWPKSLQQWPKDLPRFLTEAGMTSVVQHCSTRKPWQRAFYYDVTLLAMAETAARASDPAAVQKMVDQAAQEFQLNRRGVDIGFNSITAVGKKRQDGE